MGSPVPRNCRRTRGRQRSGKWQSVRLLERLHHRGGDTAPLGDLITVLGGPFTDRLILFPTRAAARRRPTGPRCAAALDTAPSYPGTGADVGLQGLAELAGVLLRQIDGEIYPVESEFDGAIRFASVEVIGQQ